MIPNDGCRLSEEIMLKYVALARAAAHQVGIVTLDSTVAVLT
jgi:hypothetical protein